MGKKVLIIDDDADICSLLCRYLNKNGYEAEAAYTASGGITKFKEENYDIVLCDYKLGDKNGKDVLIEIKKINPNAVVIIITGYSHIKTAVEVIKAGAFDYIAKPLIPDEVLNVLSSASASLIVSNEPQEEQIVKSKKSLYSQNGNYMVGKSKIAIDLYNQVDIVAPTNYSVILYGETGTGKEVIARTIHERSDRSNQPFMAIDCGAISKELAGSTLFGHVKGSFTGAMYDKEGHFEAANNGTVFLDEVSNLSYDIQATLLRVIQERKFKKVGGNKEFPLDIRIIVASNESLQDAVQNGRFREDLYFRFNEFTINIPPLRNRREDIPLFAEFFLDKSNKELNKKIDGFDKDVMDIFMRYAWPGNLRELRNVVRRAVLLTKSGLVTMSSLPVEIINPSHFVNKQDNTTEASIIKKDFGLKDAASRAEYETIMSVLRDVNFNKSKAAEKLNIDRKTLYNKIKNYEESQ
jgi:two-component system response regulator HydG